MRALLILLTIPMLTSCGLLKAPGRLLHSATRTFGFTQNDTEQPGSPSANASANVALQATE